MKYDKHKAVKSLKPTSEWSWGGFDYADLNWISSDTKPTESEIDAEVVRLQADYDSKEYQRKRAAEYPLVVEQLDLIYHSGIDAWKAKIKETKDKYPKP
tara:strand:- start:1543 stop:1839 length:297 start_codon:yes stop_codon:yes gene_type:complete